MEFLWAALHKTCRAQSRVQGHGEEGRTLLQNQILGEPRARTGCSTGTGERSTYTRKNTGEPKQTKSRTVADRSGWVLGNPIGTGLVRIFPADSSLATICIPLVRGDHRPAAGRGNQTPQHSTVAH